MDENLAFGLFLLLPCASGGLLLLFARYLRRRRIVIGWKQLVVGNFLVLSCFLGILLVGGEIYYRFIYDSTDALDSTKVSERWFKRYYHQNGGGCRDDREYRARIEPGKRRITFLGDSFAAGHGIKDPERRFANLIRAAHPEWEIHILARPGFDTGNELQSVAASAERDYEFDQVVLVYCLNDITDILPESAEAIQGIYDDVDHSGWLRRNSYFVNTMYYRLKLMRDPAMKTYFRLLLEGYRGPVWEQQRKRLKSLRDLVRSHGGRLSVVIFPFLDSLGPDYEYRFVHEELNQYFKELNVPSLDLLPVYQDQPRKEMTVNRYDAHPNEYAHKLAASAIDGFLSDQLAARP